MSYPISVLALTRGIQVNLSLFCVVMQMFSFLTLALDNSLGKWERRGLNFLKRRNSSVFWVGRAQNWFTVAKGPPSFQQNQWWLLQPEATGSPSAVLGLGLQRLGLMLH